MNPLAEGPDRISWLANPGMPHEETGIGSANADAGAVCVQRRAVKVGADHTAMSSMERELRALRVKLGWRVDDFGARLVANGGDPAKLLLEMRKATPTYKYQTKSEL